MFNGTDHLMKRKRIKPIFTLGLLILFLAITGCSVPNIQPFAEATATLGSGFREVGRSTTSILRDIPINDPNSKTRMSLNNKRHPSHSFSAIWDDHLSAVETIEAYSATLAEVAAANKNSKKNAEALVKPLFETAAIFPQLKIPENEARSLATLIIQTTHEMVTYHALSKQVKAAHPVFEEMVPLLQRALESAFTINKGSYLVYQTDYETKQNEMLIRWIKLKTKLKNLEDKYIDPNFTSEREDLAKQISVISEMIEHLRPDYTAFNDEIAAIENRMQTTLNLFKQSRKNLDEWLESHAVLVLALEENRQPNFTVLLNRAEEIKTAIEAIKNANKKP